MGENKLSDFSGNKDFSARYNCYADTYSMFLCYNLAFVSVPQLAMYIMPITSLDVRAQKEH